MGFGDTLSELVDDGGQITLSWHIEREGGGVQIQKLDPRASDASGIERHLNHTARMTCFAGAARDSENGHHTAVVPWRCKACAEKTSNVPKYGHFPTTDLPRIL